MKNKSKTYLSSFNVAGNSFSESDSKDLDLDRDMELNSKKSSIISFSENLSEEVVDTKDKLLKKRKRKKSENIESNESQNNKTCREQKISPLKKKKRVICMEKDQYKPGMLSDFLQKQKYGSLILPWETSFGKGSSGSNTLLDRDEAKKKEPIIKINPLFDTSKRTSEATGSNTNNTVFVGNLPEEITVNQVKKIFKKFGNTIIKIKIRSDERKNLKLVSNNTKCIGSNDQCKHAIVKFNSQDSHEAALKMTGKLFNGHHLRITSAKFEPSTDPDKSIFVGNLPLGISDDDLWKSFENCGEINSVRVIRDRLNKKGTFGYVNFKSADSATEALKLDGISVSDREIRVSQINKNVDSLSNSSTIKRIKKKKTKPSLDTVSNALESKKDGFETTIALKKVKKKKKKKQKGERKKSADRQEEV